MCYDFEIRTRNYFQNQQYISVYCYLSAYCDCLNLLLTLLNIMSAIPKSNIKRIRDILFADENRINNDVNDNQGSDSDSESDFLATESDDTSNSEHISKESDLSNSDFEHGDVVTVSQPETLKKNGVTWSMYPNFS
ncbi:unnamed protein product [Rotaria socialis]